MPLYTGTGKEQKGKKSQPFVKHLKCVLLQQMKTSAFFNGIWATTFNNYTWLLLMPAFYRRSFCMILYDSTSVATSFDFQFDRKRVSWSNTTNVTQMLKSTSEMSYSVNDWKWRVCECCIRTLTVPRAVFFLDFETRKLTDFVISRSIKIVERKVLKAA